MMNMISFEVQAKQTPYEFYLQDMLTQVGDPFLASLGDDHTNFVV